MPCQAHEKSCPVTFWWCYLLELLLIYCVFEQYVLQRLSFNPNDPQKAARPVKPARGWSSMWKFPGLPQRRWLLIFWRLMHMDKMTWPVKRSDSWKIYNGTSTIDLLECQFFLRALGSSCNSTNMQTAVVLWDRLRMLTRGQFLVLDGDALRNKLPNVVDRLFANLKLSEFRYSVRTFRKSKTETFRKSWQEVTIFLTGNPGYRKSVVLLPGKPRIERLRENVCLCLRVGELIALY